MKRQIIGKLEQIVLLMAIVFASSPCTGKMYEPELPKNLTTTDKKENMK